MGTGGAPTVGPSTTCEPSGRNRPWSCGSSATRCLRSGRLLSARAKERFPMNSGFFFDTTQLMPRSCGVTMPSVSCPMIG
jgi:hypothetical protein